VDRTACIWLIRRFIDPDATFAFFGDPAEAPEGAELFDVVGARLSHHGEDCSFETFLKEYDLDDLVLREIAEIVHDADLMDEKYARPESEGLDAIVRGMQLSLPDDQRLSATQTCSTTASTPTSAGKSSETASLDLGQGELRRTHLPRASET
jgi:hypothetical protein